MFFRVLHRKVFAFHSLPRAGGSGFVSSSQLLQGCRLGKKSHKGQAGGVHSTSGALPHTHLSIKTSVTDTHDNICANINILCASWLVDQTLTSGIFETWPFSFFVRILYKLQFSWRKISLEIFWSVLSASPQLLSSPLADTKFIICLINDCHIWFFYFRRGKNKRGKKRVFTGETLQTEGSWVQGPIYGWRLLLLLKGKGSTIKFLAWHPLFTSRTQLCW